MHRDLKPKNILIDAEKRGKICDFGFAKETSTELMNHTGNFGTYPYMAPEMLSEDMYDFSVDVYAFAVIAYDFSIFKG